ncbi:MAG: YdcH family protein [Sandarakinorhabdus sp.]|nr:YdcH family protein [Sandarakinorhabdus sp.]
MATAHLEALNARHATIEGQIAAEMTRPKPDMVQLGRLKRQKLKLKEEMTREQ